MSRGSSPSASKGVSAGKDVYWTFGGCHLLIICVFGKLVVVFSCNCCVVGISTDRGVFVILAAQSHPTGISMLATAQQMF